MLDIKNVLGEPILSDPQVLSGFREVNLDHLVAVAVPGAARPLILSEHNAVDESNFFDPRTSQVITVDHVTQVCCMNCSLSFSNIAFRT